MVCVCISHRRHVHQKQRSNINTKEKCVDYLSLHPPLPLSIHLCPLYSPLPPSITLIPPSIHPITLLPCPSPLFTHCHPPSTPCPSFHTSPLYPPPCHPISTPCPLLSPSAAKTITASIMFLSEKCSISSYLTFFNNVQYKPQ